MIANQPSVAQTIGIICIDYDYQPVPGDADHVNTFRFNVHRRVVKGLTFEKAQTGYMDPELRASFLATIQELEALDNIVGLRPPCPSPPAQLGSQPRFSKVPGRCRRVPLGLVEILYVAPDCTPGV